MISRETQCLCGLPAPCLLFKLGVSFATLNYIYLSFMQIHAAFYFNYINYSGLLIFRCQNVATSYQLLLYGKIFISRYHGITSIITI